MTSILRISACAAALICFASPALAARKQEAIYQFTAKAEEYTGRDTGGALRAEIGLLKAFLAEAQNYLAQDEEEDLALAIDRVEATSAFIDAELTKLGAEDIANKAMTRVEAKESELAKVNEEIKALEKERVAVEAGGVK